LIPTIWVIGYFHHHNLGDEQYKQTYDYLFNTFLLSKKQYAIQYIDCDKWKKETPVNDSDIFVLGGGDILNHYFLDQLRQILMVGSVKRPNKVIAFSVGLPYPDILVNTQKLAILDFIFVRTKQDLELFSEYICKDRVIYIPDISFFLLQYSQAIVSPDKLLFWEKIRRREKPAIETPYEQLRNRLSLSKKEGNLHIAVSLNRHIYSKYSPQYYTNIITQFSECFVSLIQTGYTIVFLPFNTSTAVEEPAENMENDLLIHADVFHSIRKIDAQHAKHMILIGSAMSATETLSLYDYFDFTIPMRFHACLFSIYKHVPLVPVYTTRKIRNLLADISWDYGYELETDEKDIPTIFHPSILKYKFAVVTETPHLREHLVQVCSQMSKDLTAVIPIFIQILLKPYPQIKTVGFANQSDRIIQDLFIRLQKLAETNGVSDFRLIRDPALQSTVITLISFSLTQNTDSVYNHGLREKTFRDAPLCNYKEEWKWILKNQQCRPAKIQNRPGGLFNLHYIDQIDYSGAHRFGWQYVYDNIKSLHSNSAHLYLDMYVDRTFHWKRDMYKMLGIIPYKKPWAGFIHHTFDTTFSDYNDDKLLKCPEFLESLPQCKALFVLSNTLKTQLESRLASGDFKLDKIPPVYALVHPTEYKGIPGFSMDRFLKNVDKKILHIGGWLRNIYSFYQLSIPKEYTFHWKSPCGIKQLLSNSNTFVDTIQKVAIKAKYMNNYYPVADLSERLQNALITGPSSGSYSPSLPNCSHSGSSCGSTDLITNNWHRHFYEHMRAVLSQMNIMREFTNDEYDQLLTENLVFIHLVDASAINTLIECICRNTPIFINRHPVVVELLGEDYPLYYGDAAEGKTRDLFELNTQVVELLTNTENIRKAHKYLAKMDKTVFSVKRFKDELERILCSL
jgi:hypothetical protein